MQAVILAAGKGERMGDLTKIVPKPLLKYKGKNLLEWKMDILPENINEIVLVIGYMGDKIQKKIGNLYKNKKVIYVVDEKIKGTGMALWQAQDVLKDRFIVMMGDDIYSKTAVKNATKKEWSITVKKVGKGSDSHRVEIGKNGEISGFITADSYRKKYKNGGYAFTGLYSLGKEIFNYPLVRLKTRDEWGLPQTLLQIAPEINLSILKTNFWKQITTPEDLEK